MALKHTPDVACNTFIGDSNLDLSHVYVLALCSYDIARIYLDSNHMIIRK